MINLSALSSGQLETALACSDVSNFLLETAVDDILVLARRGTSYVFHLRTFFC
jgi:hypothetical protein